MQRLNLLHVKIDTYLYQWGLQFTENMTCNETQTFHLFQKKKKDIDKLLKVLIKVFVCLHLGLCHILFFFKLFFFQDL